MRSSLRKFIKDKAFYKMVLAVALPVMAQNAVSQLVNVLDNLMVGAVGTEQMSGVTIANQFIFIFNVCLFGGLSGPGIFGAQYYGKKDAEGIKRIFRLKIWIALVLLFLALFIFVFFPETLIGLFLHESDSALSIGLTLESGLKYLKVMLWGLAPFALSQVYASTLRECRETLLPMKASMSAVAVNLLGNWLLIGGNLGCPALGVEGAAIATVLSRYVEIGILLFCSHRKKERFFYFKGIYSTLRVPWPRVSHVLWRGFPLLINETLWSGGMTMLNGLYSTHGLTAVAATNINSTFSNLFNVVFLALGSSIGIVVGNLLGDDKLKEARDTDTGMIAFSVGTCFVMGALLASLSGILPLMYNTTAEVRSAASGMLLITACCMPLQAFSQASYFTLRSGGLTGLTMLMDSGFTWGIMVPAAYITCRLTSLPLLPCYFIVTFTEIIKNVICFICIRSDRWLKNIVG